MKKSLALKIVFNLVVYISLIIFIAGGILIKIYRDVLLKASIPDQVMQTIIHQTTFVLTLFMVLLIVVLVSVIYFDIKRKILKPINDLGNSTKLIAGGDLQYRAKIDSQDELGELACSLNEMTQKLSSTLVSRDDLQKALDITNTLIEQIPVGLMIIGKDKKLIQINPAALKLFGVETDKGCIGNICHNYICPAEAGKCPVLDLGKTVDNSEKILLNKNGEKIPIIKTVRVINHGGAEVMLETFVDISERKRADEEKEKFSKQLMQSDKIASVGRLAGGVAHEINNPLGVILGFAQVAVQGMQTEDKLYMPLQSIAREALRCKNLVQELLTFSRVGKIEKELCEINEVVEGSLVLVEAQTKIRNINLIKEFQAGIHMLPISKNQIQQVIINLANNAMDAMPQGGDLVIKTSKSGGCAIIHIQDSGTGIPKEIQSKIYEPFFTTKEVGKGTGLGLALVFEIVQKHNGKIEFDSEPGKGTAFRVFLPCETSP